MTTHVAFLRGINVGGHNRMRMAELRDVAESLGYDAVETYIQSGNLVVDAPDDDPRAIGGVLESAIATEFGLEIPVMVRTRRELAAVVAAHPFGESAVENVKRYASFLATEPEPDRAAALTESAGPGERFTVGDRVVYTEIDPDVLGDARRTDVERVLGVSATRRNWAVVTAVLELAGA